MRLPSLPEQARLLGICGAPGVGKSTLAAALGHPVVPMDGFHLTDVELSRRGLLDVKGVPETFDAAGYAALLAHVRDGEEHVLAPAYDRKLEQRVAGAIAVPASGLVVTEGNYLLLGEPRWQAARHQLDVVWHLTLDDDVRRERLVARHQRSGKSLAEARAWVERVDQPNAVLVEAAAHRADLVLDLTQWTGGPDRS
ncbi:MAG: nucleoside/nucleotide kinase family protein [Nocardioides sp.]